MNSFLRLIESKFIELESEDQVDENEIEEQNTTGAIAGYNTPGAFLTPAQYEKKKKKIKYESVNTPPTFKWKDTQDQTPESGEETAQDKFPFSRDMAQWPNKDQEYPVKFTNQPYGTANIKDETQKVKITTEDVLEKKYEELLESYRKFATEDKTLSPERKVKNTIKEIAKKMQEIETMVNYNTRLKTESGISASTYGSSTQKALTKISERLIKISERVRALGE
jgi:hypothetical protein